MLTQLDIRKKTTLNSSDGFTLIELMITVFILGVLASVAIPAYKSSVKRSNRDDAIVALGQAVQQFERCFTIDNSYTGPSCPDYSAGAGRTSEHGVYNIVATAAELTTTTYRIQATPPVGSTQYNRDTNCGRYSINHRGVKTAESRSGTSYTVLVEPDDCWIP